MLRNELAKVLVLAYELVAGREVDKDVGSCECEIVARWQWRPKILANLEAEL